MNTERLEPRSQTVYAGTRGVFPMIDVPIEQGKKPAPPKEEGQKQVQDQQKAAPETKEQIEAKQKAEAEKKFKENPLAKTLEEDQRARKGARDYAKIRVEGKTAEGLIVLPREKGVMPKEVRVLPQSEKDAYIKTIFPDLPSDANILKVANIFAEKAQVQNLSELNTGFLVSNYLLLRDLASVNEGKDTEDSTPSYRFLRKLEQELKKRGIKVDAIMDEAENQVDNFASEHYNDYKEFLKQEKDKKKRRKFRKALLESGSGTGGIYYGDIDDPTLRSRCAQLNEKLARNKKDAYAGQIGDLAVAAVEIGELPGITNYGEKQAILMRIKHRIDGLNTQMHEAQRKEALLKAGPHDPLYQYDQGQREFTNRVAEASARGLPLMGGGALPNRTYTDPVVIRLHEQINQQIAAMRGPNAVVGDRDPGESYDLLNTRYSDVRSATGLTAAGETERTELLEDISRAMRRTQERLSESENRRYSQYGERRFTPTQLTKLRQDIARLAFTGDPALNPNAIFPPGVAPDVFDEEDEPTRNGAYVDYMFNRMFDRMEGRLLEDWHAFGTAGSIEKEEFTSILNEMSTREGIRKLIEEGVLNGNFLDIVNNPERVQRIIDSTHTLREKYDAEFNARELLHNAFYIAETGGDFKDFAGYCSRFLSLYADQAFLNSPEVEAALRIREQALYQIKAENNGYIPPELISYNPHTGHSEWEHRTMHMMRDLNASGAFAPVGEHGRVEDWRIARAISLSRGLGMATLRFPEIIAECKLHMPPNSWEAQASIPWEKLAWDLNPMDHKVKRYGWGFDLRAVLYAAAHRKKNVLGKTKLWNQDVLKDAIAFDEISVIGSAGGDQRILDEFQNFFHTGGPYTHTGWRSFDSAMDEYREELRPLLAKNPGLTMNVLWNKYENEGHGKKRRELVRNEPDENKRKALWEKFKKEDEERYQAEKKNPNLAKESGKSQWQENERRMWMEASGRIPHVVLRIMAEPANKIGEKGKYAKIRDTILKEVFGNRAPNPQEVTQLYSDLTLAKEHLMKRRREWLANPQNDPAAFPEDRLNDRDFDVILHLHSHDPNHQPSPAELQARRDRAERFRNTVQGRLSEGNGKNTMMDDIWGSVEKSKFAYALTTEDVPWGEFHYTQTGNRGYFTRKINDAFADAEADGEMEFLIKHLAQFKSPEEIVGQLRKIYDKAEIHSKEHARTAITTLATGLVRFYEKDAVTKIPILGEFLSVKNAIQRRGNSFAQTQYGRQAMEWDSDDIYNFTEQLRSILDLKEVEQIRKETGGTLWHALGKKTKNVFYLLTAVLVYEFIEKVVSEK